MDYHARILASQGHHERAQALRDRSALAHETDADRSVAGRCTAELVRRRSAQA